MLTNRLAREGRWLFRYRSYLPLLLLAPLASSLFELHDYLGHEHWRQHLWGGLCCGLAWLGLLLRATTVGFVRAGTSGRNTREQLATELNTTGWYATCRNPLYLGNFLIGLGISAAWADLDLVVAYVCAFWLYYERIIACEEAFLLDRFGREYSDWAERTPVFVPDLRRWRAPAQTFCWRTVLRREYTAVLLIGLAFEFIDVSEHIVIDHRFYLDPSWTWQLAACGFGYVALRTLKKHTTWLQVEGR